MSADLSVRVAGVRLKNPVIAGSGEATMTFEGIVAALDAGASAVVAKSTNESAAAKHQLEANFIRQLKTNNGVGQTIGFNEHVYGDFREMFRTLPRYRAVTAADCQRATHR